MLRFGEADAHEAYSDGKAGGDPEDRLSRARGSADTQIGTGSKNVAERVALLQDTRHETAGVDRATLQGHCDGVAIEAAHEETKETSDAQELLKSGAVYGGNLQKTKDQHIDDHGPFASEFVASKAEKGGADGAEKQSQGDGGGDISLGCLLVVGEFDRLDGQGVEVKGIGGPCEEADNEEEPIFRTELHEELDGILERFG